MPDTEPADQAGAFKARYYDALETLERREREWSAVESVLRQGLLRLALAAESQYPALAADLAALRDAIRRGSDSAELAPFIGTLSERLARTQEAAPGEDVLLALLRALPLPPPLAAAGEALQAQLRAGRPAAELVPAMVELLREAAEPAAQPRRAWLGRLWAGRASPPPPTPAAEDLSALLQRLPLPEDLQPRAASLRQRLAAGVPPRQSFAELADLIAELARRAQSERGELAEFLELVTLRLQELDRHLTDSAELHQAGRQGGQAMDQAVRTEMRGIQDSVRRAADLDALKQGIQRRLEAIGSHMDAFRHAEEERERRAQAQVAELLGRLREVEGESESLRRRVEQAHRQALLDPLTGIANRLAYEQRLAQELARVRRYGTALALLLWDVDRFKSINDAYGHTAGDKVLKIVAQRLDDNIRETDFVARYGGEEFVMLMPETPLQAARPAAEKLRQLIEACEFHYRDRPVPVTVSCGVVACRPDDSAEALFERADRLLYRAKSEGRNRCLAEPA